MCADSAWNVVMLKSHNTGSEFDSFSYDLIWCYIMAVGRMIERIREHCIVYERSESGLYKKDLSTAWLV